MQPLHCREYRRISTLHYGVASSFEYESGSSVFILFPWKPLDWLKQSPKFILFSNIQAHDSFLGDTHKFIPFNEYRRIPGRYDRPICPVHAKNLSLACETCDMLACEECDLTSNCGNYSKYIYKLYIPLTL